jgi:hypothetical protein
MSALDLHDEALVTQEEAELYLNLEEGSDDQRIKTLINSVSCALLNYTERKFTPAVACVDDYLHFDPAESSYFIIDQLVTEWSPVTTLTSLTIDGTAYTVGDVVIDAYGGLLFLPTAVSTLKKYVKVVINYEAGYAETPPDIKQVVMDTVGFYYKKRFLEYDMDVIDKGGRPDEVFFPESCRKVVRDYTRDML